MSTEKQIMQEELNEIHKESENLRKRKLEILAKLAEKNFKRLLRADRLLLQCVAFL